MNHQTSQEGYKKEKVMQCRSTEMHLILHLSKPADYVCTTWIVGGFPGKPANFPGEPMISNYIQTPKLGAIAQHQLKLHPTERVPCSSAKFLVCYLQAKKLTFLFTHRYLAR